MLTTPALRVATMLATVTFLALALLLPTPAAAGTYWWSGAPAAGANGFSFSSADQPWWNPWGGTGRCETRGATIPAGNPCILAWHVPAGLDARAGAIGGSYKQSNPAFEQHNTVECNGTTVLQGTSTIQSFNRTWPDMCSYLSVGVLTPAAATTVSAASQFFDATSFSVELVDPSLPSIELVDGQAGWKGAAGTCIRYVVSDAGSGLQATSLVNATTGQVIDAPSWATSAIVTGAWRSDRTPCMAAPGTGTFTLRTTVVDKSGNQSQVDVQVSFDLTAPAIGIPHANGVVVADGRRFLGSDGEYRPTFSTSASDPHSGIASSQVLLDGAIVASGTTWTPTADLAPGVHVVSFRATDAVGNASTVSRSFAIVDDVAPTIVIDSPGASGGSTPVLDASATDDLSGLDAASWTVHVNGEVLVAGSDTRRIQADIGALVDGTHELQVRIADLAGNPATETITYVADSGDGLPDPPTLTGLHLLQSPDRVEEGTTHRILAIATRAGRPVDGTFELRDDESIVATVDASTNGVVDMSATIGVPGPLQLHAPAGSGLEPVTISYAFIPTPVDPCIAQPLAAGCPGVGDGDGDGGEPGGGPTTPQSPAGNTTIINMPVPVAPVAGGGAPNDADARSPYPRDIVYFVNGVPYWNGLPLAESGAPLDRVAPTWRMSVRHERPGMVKGAGRIALRLWTSEMSVLSISPQGSPRRISVNPRRKLRTIHVRYDRRSHLGRRIARTRAGGIVVVRMRIVATDKNENSSRPRTLTFRIRV